MEISLIGHFPAVPIPKFNHADPISSITAGVSTAFHTQHHPQTPHPLSWERRWRFVGRTASRAAARPPLCIVFHSPVAMCDYIAARLAKLHRFPMGMSVCVWMQNVGEVSVMFHVWLKSGQTCRRPNRVKLAGAVKTFARVLWVLLKLDLYSFGHHFLQAHHLPTSYWHQGTCYSYDLNCP